MILGDSVGSGPRACFCIADTLAGAAPFGEDLTVVVVGGGERQPVSNPLESVQRTAAVLRTPDGLQCSAVVGFGSGDLSA